MKTNSISAWVLAVRPYSLGASAIPVLAGSAMAWTGGMLHWYVAILCLVFAVLTQCTANLVNDLCDFQKGADLPDRLGPDRAFAKGFITLRAMQWGIGAFTFAACLAGLGVLALVYEGLPWGGLELILVGMACITFAYFYTAGPWSLAYHGLGDVAVILFFGVIPAGFSYFLQTGEWNWSVTIVGLACGLIIDTMLWVNNFRDREEDARCGKRTIIVYLGERVGRWGYLVLGSTAVILCLTLWFDGYFFAAILPLIYWPLFFMTWRKMIRIGSGDELNVCLGETARNMLIFGLLLTIGIILG